MKKFYFVMVIAIFLSLATPNPTFAFGLTPFAGRVTSVRTPPTVQCGTSLESPFMISPIVGIPGPWSALPGQVNAGRIIPQAWIMGLVMPAPGACMTTSVPSVPFPTAATNFYGTSANFGL
jgi:hypothetical protein